MKNQPLVSVIVPVFNTEEVVERTLNSICTQTYKNFELIIINDGSTDASEEVCKLFVEKDSRVRYFYKENGGVSSARNLGLAKARGEYILFCDSDDKWEMTLLEVVVNQMTEGNYDIRLTSFIGSYGADAANVNACALPYVPVLANGQWYKAQFDGSWNKMCNADFSVTLKEGTNYIRVYALTADQDCFKAGGCYVNHDYIVLPKTVTPVAVENITKTK